MSAIIIAHPKLTVLQSLRLCCKHLMTGIPYGRHIRLIHISEIRSFQK